VDAGNPTADASSLDTPGALNPEPVAQALAEEVKNLQSAFIGTGIHYLQEDHPEIIGRTIADWRRRVYKASGE